MGKQELLAGNENESMEKRLEEMIEEADIIWFWMKSKFDNELEFKIKIASDENLQELLDFDGRGEYGAPKYYYEFKKREMENSGEWNDKLKRISFETKIREISTGLKKVRVEIIKEESGR